MNWQHLFKGSDVKRHDKAYYSEYIFEYKRNKLQLIEKIEEKNYLNVLV